MVVKGPVHIHLNQKSVDQIDQHFRSLFELDTKVLCFEEEMIDSMGIVDRSLADALRMEAFRILNRWLKEFHCKKSEGNWVLGLAVRNLAAKKGTLRMGSKKNRQWLALRLEAVCCKIENHFGCILLKEAEEEELS